MTKSVNQYQSHRFDRRLIKLLSATAFLMICFVTLNIDARENNGTRVDTRAFKHGAVQQSGIMEFHPNGILSGFKYAFVAELANRIGWDDEHQKCPFQRCLFSMANGSLDLMVFVSATSERDHYLDFIQVWPSSRVIPFYMRDTEQHRLTRYEDLSNLRIGVVNGYAYFPQFDKDESLQKITVTTELQLAHMLQANRIDTYIAFDPIKGESNYRDQLIVKAPFEQKVESSALIAISKKSALHKYLPSIEKEIMHMIEDGTLQALWSQSFSGQDFPYPLIPYPKHNLKQSHSSALSFEQHLPNVSTKK